MAKEKSILQHADSIINNAEGNVKGNVTITTTTTQQSFYIFERYHGVWNKLHISSSQAITPSS